MNPHDLIATARILLDSNSRKPTMVSCRRAVSACYYALFHCLARECADLLIGGAGANRPKGAWRQAYRALEHAYVKSQCLAASRKGFPKEIVDFADLFVTMQIKRHDADYDPAKRFVKSDVANDISLVEAAIQVFRSASRKDRMAFCAWVILKDRKS